MKKLITILLAIAICAVLTATTMASTIGVAVTPGFSIDLDRDLATSNDPLYITAGYGFNEQLLVRAIYNGSTASSTSDLTVDARYLFAKNMALTLAYQTTNNNKVTIGFRPRFSLNDKIDLAGQFEYYNNKTNISGTNIFPQAEFKLTEIFTANLGYLLNTESNTSTGTVKIGGEFYPDKHWCPYFDYSIATVSGGTNVLNVGVTYSF